MPRPPGHVECCRVRAGHESGPPRSCDKTGCASGGRGNLRSVRAEQDKASSTTLPNVAKAARLAEALGPKPEVLDAFRSVGQRYARTINATRAANLPSVAKAARAAESLSAALAPLADTLAAVKPLTTTRIPEGLLRTAQRWASMSPRQRARAMLAEVRRRARRVPAAFRAALSRAIARTRANLDALTAQAPPGHLHRAASPSHGPPLALVLLDSTRPVHGPPVPA